MHSQRKDRKGLFVVLLGPDGSGKSTVVTNISKICNSDYNDVWRFHWRPGLLPKLSRNKAVQDIKNCNESGKPPATSKYGFGLSLLRYLYYLSDFVVGYWLIVRPKRRKGFLILGERWYYDVIVSPERYGFALPKWLISIGSVVVPNPDLTVLLEADPVAIHQRKPELSTEHIRSQLDKLASLLPDSPKGICVWSGGPVEKTPPL